MIMESRKEAMSGKWLIMALSGGLAAAFLLGFTATGVRADSALSCYKGDKDDNVYIGEISEADFADAAGECNSFYGDCNGECFGCYQDPDATKEVCVDAQGKKFTR